MKRVSGEDIELGLETVGDNSGKCVGEKENNWDCRKDVYRERGMTIWDEKKRNVVDGVLNAIC